MSAAREPRPASQAAARAAWGREIPGDHAIPREVFGIRPTSADLV
jgi:hypothetical protein